MRYFILLFYIVRVYILYNWVTAQVITAAEPLQIPIPMHNYGSKRALWLDADIIFYYTYV